MSCQDRDLLSGAVPPTRDLRSWRLRDRFSSAVSKLLHAILAAAGKVLLCSLQNASCDLGGCRKVLLRGRQNAICYLGCYKTIECLVKIEICSPGPCLQHATCDLGGCEKGSLARSPNCYVRSWRLQERFSRAVSRTLVAILAAAQTVESLVKM